MIFSVNRRRRAAKLLFYAAFVFLTLWAFQGFRTWARFKMFALFGFGQHPGIENFPEDIPLSHFQPETMMKAVRTEEPQIPRLETIEFHGHLFSYDKSRLIGEMDKNRITYFVNLDPRTAEEDAYRKLVQSTGNSPRILHFGTFNWKRLETTDDFGPAMAADLEKLARAGMKGVKLWKNFGLMFKTRDGKLLSMDDARLDPVWDVCARYKLLIAIHTADPPAFFQKTDEKNERFDELARSPEWSFANPEFPPFAEILRQRERMFAKHRNVRFVALHFGELAHDLKEAGGLLDRNPNVNFDLAQRIDELGRQPRAAREFFLKYQDRILYGIDGPPDHEKARIYWRFLETTDEYFDYHPPHKPRKGLWKISGLYLPDPVLRKIYFANAARLIGLAH